MRFIKISAKSYCTFWNHSSCFPYLKFHFLHFHFLPLPLSLFTNIMIIGKCHVFDFSLNPIELSPHLSSASVPVLYVPTVKSSVENRNVDIILKTIHMEMAKDSVSAVHKFQYNILFSCLLLSQAYYFCLDAHSWRKKSPCVPRFTIIVNIQL